MANYYTQFSFVVGCADPGRVGAEYRRLTEDEDGSVLEDDFEEHPIFDEVEDLWMAPAVRVDGDSVWISDDAGESSVWSAALIVKWILGSFDGVPGEVFFTWSDSCDKQRADGFSGGAALVRADGIAMRHASEAYGSLAAELDEQWRTGNG